MNKSWLVMAVACGSSTTRIYDNTISTEEGQYGTTAPVYSDAGIHDSSTPVGISSPVSPSKKETEEVQHVDPICFTPDDQLLGAVRASTRRFAQRLEIPIVLGEGCIPITVQKEVVLKGTSVSALAHYDKICSFSSCNHNAFIVVAEVSLHEQLEWLPNLLDHEIGHILSAWGRYYHNSDQSGHLALPDIMAATVTREAVWTQEDIDLWCSASPCGKTLLEPSWQIRALPPLDVADGGTSYLSDGGLTDATGDSPEDGGS